MGRPRGASTGRERLAQAAGRGFRMGGFGGVGVDGLAREAGLTSGAFYAHFGSKAKAFEVALVEGLDSLRAAVERFQAEHGAEWLAPFVDFYLGARMELGLEEACALPTLTADVARAVAETRQAYEAALRGTAFVIARGLAGPDADSRAWALLSILSGGAGMARAVPDAALRRTLLSAAGAAAKSV